MNLVERMRLFVDAEDGDSGAAWELLIAAADRIEALENLTTVAASCVEDQRAQYPEEPPRWTDCHCAGPKTEELADALIRASSQGNN